MENYNIQTLLIEINQKCNFKCTYCLYNDLELSKRVLNLEDIKSLILKYRKLKEIYITGGEPTLNKNLEEIIRYLSKRYKVNLFTNGSLINKTIDEEILLNNLNIIFISIHRSSQNQRKVVFDKIYKLIKKNPDKVCIKTTLTNQNVDEFGEIINHFKKKGCKKFSINFAHDLKSSKEKFRIRDKSKIENIFNIIDQNKKMFLFPNYLKRLRTFMLNRRNMANSCKAGESFRYIDCEKNDFICPDNQSTSLKDVDKNKCFSNTCVALWEFY
jgi:MoaA/NifB/PqqE/SkfB family radical SAM enzyme